MSNPFFKSMNHFERFESKKRCDSLAVSRSLANAVAADSIADDKIFDSVNREYEPDPDDILAYDAWQLDMKSVEPDDREEPELDVAFKPLPLLEKNASKTIPWAFTIKKLGGKPNSITLADYSDVLELYAKSGKISHSTEERDSSGRLHIHGILELKKHFFIKKLCRNGFHMKFDELFDEEGWRRYINKSFDNQRYAL